MGLKQADYTRQEGGVKRKFVRNIGITSNIFVEYSNDTKVHSITNHKAGYTRQRGWDTMQERELIVTHLNQYNKITREDVVELCRCTPNHASWLLRQLVKAEIIQLCGAGRGAFYIKR